MKLSKKIVLALVDYMCTYRIFRTVWQSFPMNMQDATIAGTTKVVERVLKSELGEFEAKNEAQTEVDVNDGRMFADEISKFLGLDW